MVKSYVVEWGKTGKKKFRKLDRAESFSQAKANKTGKTVDIDKVVEKQKPHVITRSHYKYIKPKK